MKLLLLDEDDQLLLIHARDPQTQVECWYPVSGGVEPGETLQEAARARERRLHPQGHNLNESSEEAPDDVVRLHPKEG